MARPHSRLASQSQTPSEQLRLANSVPEVRPALLSLFPICHLTPHEVPRPILVLGRLFALQTHFSVHSLLSRSPSCFLSNEIRILEWVEGGRGATDLNWVGAYICRGSVGRVGVCVGARRGRGWDGGERVEDGSGVCRLVCSSSGYGFVLTAVGAGPRGAPTAHIEIVVVYV